MRVCRSGYTGEHGYELLPPWDSAGVVFDALVGAVTRADGQLAGLGARDTLRTEMGYPLHGHELSADISPLQARCGWAIGWKKDAFFGRDALLAEKEAGPRRLLRGLRAVGRGVLRPDLNVLDGDTRRRRHDVGHVLADVENRYRVGAHRRRRRRRGRPARHGRRPRPRPRVRSRQARPSSTRKPASARLYNRLMTSGVLEFTVSRAANPATDEARHAILADPGFGKYHTDHMVSIDYTEDQGWHDARVAAYGPIELDPSAIVLHYAQEIFEGLKAYRWADGSIVSFRAEANAARLRTSARRIAIPELPDELFLESLRQLDRGRQRLGAAGRRRGVALPAAVHLRHRARAGGAARQAVPLHGDRLAGGGVLQGRHQAGNCLGLNGLRAGQPGWHRRGQVRRQLCRLAGRPGRGRRERAANRWCGWTPSSAATSKRWAG